MKKNPAYGKILIARYQDMDTLFRTAVKSILRIYVKHFPIWMNHDWFYMNSKNIELVLPIVEGKYEKYNTKLFKKIIKKGQTIVDIGAYIGYYTVLFAKLVGRRGKIIAFEPDPYNRKLLKKNLKLNRIKNVILHKEALGDQKRISKLYVNAPDSSLIKASRENKEAVDVSVNTLDNIIKNEQIDLIKMDVQGYEPYIFKGAMETIRKNKSLILHVEFWPEGLERAAIDPADLLVSIMESGFKIFVIDDKTERLVYIKDIAKMIRKTKNNPGGFLDLLCKREA